MIRIKKLSILLALCSYCTISQGKEAANIVDSEVAATAGTIIKKLIKGIKKGYVSFDVTENDVNSFVSKLPEVQLRNITGGNKRERLEKKLFKLAPVVAKKLNNALKHCPDTVSVDDKSLEKFNHLVNELKNGSKNIRLPSELMLGLTLALSNLPAPFMQALFDLEIFQ